MKHKTIAPGLRLIIGFALLIIVGSIILNLPISHNSTKVFGYVDYLFVSCSAVCVTGLTPMDISLSLSVFGKIVLAILIQMGGLGFASFAIFFLLILGRQISQQDRTLIKISLNSNSHSGLVSLVKTVLTFAFIIETVGTILTFISIHNDYAISEAIGISIFHSISAFNNAGFDLFGNFSSLTSYSTNPLMLITTAILIILGGLGFFVITDILKSKHWRKFKNHTRIVLLMTFLLLVGGTVAIYFTQGNISLLSAFFQS
ncbi:MAG: potassium transporter TrkG, partial [Sphaerochaetaceae bacterium]|nr:potassium transporter TrkG [Sphaerochaetaceae bacterium]